MCRFLLVLALAFLLSSPAALAQQATPEAAQQATVNIPPEYKAFFDEYSALAKKYPEAARRFGIYDSAPTSKQAIRSSGFCSGGSHCCTRWINEGSRYICVQCSLCLP
jgi:hypothetical protein